MSTLTTICMGTAICLFTTLVAIFLRWLACAADAYNRQKEKEEKEEFRRSVMNALSDDNYIQMRFTNIHEVLNKHDRDITVLNQFVKPRTHTTVGDQGGKLGCTIFRDNPELKAKRKK